MTDDPNSRKATPAPPMLLELRGRPTSQPLGKDYEESARLAAWPGVTPRACYQNCFTLVYEVPGYEGASYVEGYVVADDGFPFDHAWLVKDALIVDPTLPVGIKRYAAGLEFVGVSGIEAFLETVGKDVRTLHDAFRHGGFTSPSYCRAYLDAFAEVPGFVPPPSLLATLERSTEVRGEFVTVVQKADLPPLPSEPACHVAWQEAVETARAALHLAHAERPPSDGVELQNYIERATDLLERGRSLGFEPSEEGFDEG